MPRIIIENQLGFACLIGDMEVVLDGRTVARLPRNGKADLSLSAGAHSIQARAGGICSESLDFRLDERETIGFACSKAGFWSKDICLHEVFHWQAIDRFGSARPAQGGERQKGATHLEDDGTNWDAVLNISKKASMSEIRRAYLKLIWKYHPDRIVNLSGQTRAAAERAARKINVAYTAAKKARRDK